MCWKHTDKVGSRVELARTTYFRFQQQRRHAIWFFFPPVIWIECFFSAEASRHKVPGVKVNRNTALFSPHPPAPASCAFPINPFICARKKQETCSIASLIWEALIQCGQINTHTKKTQTQHPSAISIWVLRAGLTVVSFLSFQRVMKLFSLSICCTRSSLTCWRRHKDGIRGS